MRKKQFIFILLAVVLLGGFIWKSTSKKETTTTTKLQTPIKCDEIRFAPSAVRCRLREASAAGEFNKSLSDGEIDKLVFAYVEFGAIILTANVVRLPASLVQKWLEKNDKVCTNIVNRKCAELFMGT